MKKNTFLFSLIIAFAFSCNQDVNFDSQAELYVRYEQGPKKLIAEASFYDLAEGKKGSSKVFQSGVAFINSGMQTSTLPGGLARYRYSMEGKLPEQVYFLWKNGKGQQERVDIQMLPMEELRVEGDNISRSKGFKFHFNGQPLEASEKLVIVFVDASNNGLTLEITGPSENSTFEVAPGKYSGLELGRCQMEIVRTRTDETAQDGTKVQMTAEYYAKPIFVDLVE